MSHFSQEFLCWNGLMIQNSGSISVFLLSLSLNKVVSSNCFLIDLFLSKEFSVWHHSSSSCRHLHLIPWPRELFETRNQPNILEESSHPRWVGEEFPQNSIGILASQNWDSLSRIIQDLPGRTLVLATCTDASTNPCIHSPEEIYISQQLDLLNAHPCDD